jgi:peptidyl-prolyl cis-trans isomerase B (cyclophilin B)
MPRGVGRSKVQHVTCVLFSGLVAGLSLGLAGCGGGGDGSGSDAAATRSANGCASVEAPAPRDGGGQSAPTEELDASKTWTLTFDTSCGTFVVTLDLDSAPRTSASLVSLARAGYFDDTIFHRIVPGFVIQGGDPTQAGSGGPGYSTVDRPAANASYTKGVVAMAKTATEPAGTAGSQFFVVTGDDAGLSPEYAVVGTVTDGLAVVERIGALGDPATEQPLRPVVIDSVTVGSSS